MTASAKRKPIREALKQRIQAALSAFPSAQVYTTVRTNVSEQADPYVNIYFLKGDVEHSGNFRNDDATLILRIGTHQQETPEDLLDELAELIEAEVDESFDLQGLVSGIQQTGWQYGTDNDSGHNYLALMYSVAYSNPI